MEEIDMPFLNIMNENGINILSKCMNGAYHYCRNGMGVIQVYPPSNDLEWGIGWIEDGRWDWHYTSSLVEFESILKRGIKLHE